MARSSIRLRLAAWYGGLTALTIAGLGLAVGLLMARSLMERIDGGLDFEFREAAESADATAAFHEVYHLRILGSDGRVLAESPALVGVALAVPPLGEAEGPSAHASLELGPLGPCRVVAGAVGSGADRRTLVIATSLRSHEEEIRRLRGVLWTILPAGLIAATLGGYWLAGRALAPVGRMTAAARRITAANLGERIAVANPEDELGRLATTLNAMLDRIDRAFIAARRFTADAAHELRTPLATIRTEAEVALAAPRSAEHDAETLRSVVEEVERLARLADRLLALAREDSGAALPREPIRLDEIVGEAVARVRGPIRVGGLASPIVVAGDRDLLRQVVDNLLDNALKATAEAGEVAVSCLVADGRAIVAVADTGIGIPPEALPRVFDRFYRVDPSRSRRTGGTGLGLSLVKSVVERHGGTVSAESTPGVGSTFRVVLPTANDHAAFHKVSR